MPDIINHLIANSSNFINWYSASLIFGWVCLVAFANRRLNTKTSEFVGPQAILNDLDVLTVAGKKPLRNSVYFYLIVLTIIYLSACLCQPIAGFFWQGKVSDLWATPAGPLTVASAIIAFGPTFKPFQDIESSIRQYAHRLAGIPDDLFSIIDNIRRFDIELYSESTGIGEKVSDFADDAFRYSLILLGDLERSRSLHTNIKAAFTLSNWTFGTSPKGIWAARALNSLEKITKRQSEKVKNIETNLRVLISDSAKSNPVVNAPNALNLPKVDYGRPITEAQKEYIKTASALDDAVSIRERWETIAKEIEWLAQENEAIFCVFAINDKSPNVPKENKALNELLNLTWDQRMNSVANIALFAGVASLLSTAVAIFGFKVLKTLYRNDPVNPIAVMSDAIHIAFSNSLFMIPLFVLPIAIVLSMRFSLLHDRSWVFMDKFFNFPYFQSGKLVFYAAILTILLANFFTIGIRIVSYGWALAIDGDGGSSAIYQELVQSYFGSAFGIKTVQSIAGAVFGVTVAVVFDLIERNRVKLSNVLPLMAVALFVVLLLFVGSAIDMQASYLNPLSSSSGYTVAWYDHMVQDIVVISTFTISFVLTVSAVGRQPREDQYAYSRNAGSIEPPQRVW